MTLRKLGLEEELLLVDRDTGRVRAVAGRAVRAHEDGDTAGEGPQDSPEVAHELFLQQVETSTSPCRTADELLTELRRGRRAVQEAAEQAGVAAVAMPTPVLGEPEEVLTPKQRYRRIEQEYGELAREASVCAMHLHVDVSDDAEGVAVIDRVRPWLPVLLAISANSPFHRGRDTRHASWRSQVWGRWPSAGPQEPFGDLDAYRRVTRRIIGTGASMDPGMLYFDARLAESYPTVEIRVADVCTDLDDAVLVAVLARALLETCAEHWRAGADVPSYRTDLLRSASWLAARDGVTNRLVHPEQAEPAPVRDVLGALVAFVHPALDEAGDLELVHDSLERLLTHGGGATRQRRVLETSGDLAAVVRDLVERTDRSWRAG